MNIYRAFADLKTKYSLGEISTDQYFLGVDSLRLSVDELIELETIFEDEVLERFSQKVG